MTTRTSSKLVTFMHPFKIDEMDEIHPAGSYKVETDEELIQGISFAAYKSVLTVIHLHSKSKNKSLTRALTIPATQLEIALQNDKDTDDLESEK